jgi:hypothetical protein
MGRVKGECSMMRGSEIVWIVCRYYVTGSPQCPFPDENMGAVLNAVSFDAVYVQVSMKQNLPDFMLISFSVV